MDYERCEEWGLGQGDEGHDMGLHNEGHFFMHLGIRLGLQEEHCMGGSHH